MKLFCEIIIFLLLTTSFIEGNNCPTNCTCFGYTSSWISDCATRQFEGVPDDIPENSTEIFLQNNRINRLVRNSFAGLKVIEFLYLHNNDISLVESSTFAESKSSLKYLTLNKNKIANLPDDIFNGMTSLGVLNLNDNNLTSIPSSLLHSLTSLVQVSFCNNQLTSIDANLFIGLSKLRYVGLSSNQLESIPDVLGNQSPEMYVIDYADNRLTRLPSVSNSTQQLYASANLIKTISSQSLAGATSLNEIFLQRNQISSIEEGAFVGAKSLGWIDLTGNYFSKVDDVMFDNLPTLQGIYLTANKLLTSISSKAFQSSKNTLSRLLIDNCSLTWIDVDVIKSLKSSNLYVWMGGNPWNCDCSLKGLAELISGQTEKFYDVKDVTCASPNDVRGRRVDEVTAENYFYCQPWYNETALIVCSSVIAVIAFTAIVVFLVYTKKKKEVSTKFTAATQTVTVT